MRENLIAVLTIPAVIAVSAGSLIAAWQGHHDVALALLPSLALLFVVAAQAGIINRRDRSIRVLRRSLDIETGKALPYNDRTL